MPLTSAQEAAAKLALSLIPNSAATGGQSQRQVRRAEADERGQDGNQADQSPVRSGVNAKAQNADTDNHPNGSIQRSHVLFHNSVFLKVCTTPEDHTAKEVSVTWSPSAGQRFQGFGVAQMHHALFQVHGPGFAPSAQQPADDFPGAAQFVGEFLLSDADRPRLPAGKL